MRADRPMRRYFGLVGGILAAGLLLSAANVMAQRDPALAVISSRHDLSASGPGQTSSSEQNACIFCHGSHLKSGGPRTPMWNRELSSQTYNTYASSTYDAGPGQPSAGVSKLCLSCHDGTIALGQTVNRGLISASGRLGNAALIETDLTNDHPFGITPVDDGQLVAFMFQDPPSTADSKVKLVSGRVECTTCHNAHDPAGDPDNRKFLIRSNANGALCLACHDPGRPVPNALNGWELSAHRNSAAAVPKTTPFAAYGTVGQNACANCHRSHGGPWGSKPLMREVEETTCVPCHSGANVNPAIPDVMRDFSKAYAHPTTSLAGLHDPKEDAFPLGVNRHAECADCHQPHRAQIERSASVPPAVGPALFGVSGFSAAGVLLSAANEFEVCFKCHSTSPNKPQGPAFAKFGRIPDRLAEQGPPDAHDLLAKFSSAVARHNVMHSRRLSPTQVPSLRDNILNLNGSPGRSLAVGTYISCSDCHNNSQARRSGGTGANGPHGSDHIHLLERRYDLEPPPVVPGGLSAGVAYLSGINGSASVCNKCHDIDNSIRQDRSFPKHDKHIRGERTSCATCHDPHGIDGGTAANNHSLMSFDLTVVGPSSSGLLRYERTGVFSGRCYLTCHGQNHDPETY